MVRAINACACAVAVVLASSTSSPAEKPMTLETKLATAVMKGGQTQKNFLRIALGGCERPPTERTPVNVAFVIDRSGSMQGSRIAQAREAAITAIRRLDQNDIASVVIFDDKIEMLVPAQPVADHNVFADRIRQVAARGSTAIYGGVTEGAHAVRKNKDNKRLNRVVLLSDGLANVGPRNPSDFETLGRDLLAEGISVSTIGLGMGYNEDLMLKLARASDGNHTFVGDATDLIQVFNKEFDDVLGSCAQTVSIDVEMNPGVRVVRALSRDGKIDGRKAQFLMNQVYQATEHYLLLEVEVDQSIAAGDGKLGRVAVAYTAPQDGSRQTLEAPIHGRFSTSETEIAASRDNAVLESVVEQSVRLRTEKAIEARDQGRAGEAAALFSANVAEIESQAAAAPLSQRLQYLKQQYDAIAATPPAASAGAWGGQRKLLRQMDANPASPGSRY
jgi:Ca-activated chloride channel family protein